MIKYWTPGELATLRRLREGFLTGTAGHNNYWRSPEDLALYDSTFAERIGWKWEAALNELEVRNWSPTSTKILDWGCGSGIASRRVLQRWPNILNLSLFDRSPLAARFAAQRARELNPKLQVQIGEQVDEQTLLVLSHVINELPPHEFSRVLDMVRKAGEVIWLEAGAREESRQLSLVREKLLAHGPRFQVIAPCTHQAACGILASKNEHHWCHHFAQPPSEIFQDARWFQFSRELGIDLRSLPYSFLVLSRKDSPTPQGFSRVIGQPREFKGHDKVLSCHEGGVTELMLQKRDAPDLLKELRRFPVAPVYRWTLENGKILGAQRIDQTT